MRYEKINGITHIYAEDGETEQQALRAIVKASFEMARPAGLGWNQFNDNDALTDEQADIFILDSDPATAGRTIVRMSYVLGRQCKTVIYRESPGHFTLYKRFYESYRGVPEPMLERAKEILAGKNTGKFSTTGYMFKKESLDLRLERYGYSRKSGESDWKFRKRIFPDLFFNDPEIAMEFLMGASMAEWDGVDGYLIKAFLINAAESSPDGLSELLKNFPADPLDLRERRQSVQLN